MRTHGGNWKGGRTITTDGYVCIWVGKDHPIADGHGYAKEHRLIAQQMMDRPLLRSEPVSHIDGNKQNNSPDNLLIGRYVDRSGPKSPTWKGGRKVTNRGYVLVAVAKDHHLANKEGYALEHRLVAEEMLGRRLLPTEVVHHKDKDTENNIPSNLEVFPSHSEHLKKTMGENHE